MESRSQNDHLPFLTEYLGLEANVFMSHVLALCAHHPIDSMTPVDFKILVICLHL
jgi:hypothetical protein